MPELSASDVEEQQQGQEESRILLVGRKAAQHVARQAIWRSRLQRLCWICSPLVFAAACGLSARKGRRIKDDAVSMEMLSAASQVAGCHDTICGEVCYQFVQTAMRVEIISQPFLYPGLNATSSFEEFQAHIHRSGQGLCAAPCSQAIHGRTRTFRAMEGVLVDEGLALASYAHRNYSLHECEVLCGQSQRCKSFAYSHEDGACHLKERCAGMRSRLQEGRNDSFRTYIDAACRPDRQVYDEGPYVLINATNESVGELPAAPAQPVYDPRCSTAGFGSMCYDRVFEVQMHVQPGEYPGITPFSTFEEVQSALHQSYEANCPMPCPEPTDPSFQHFSSLVASSRGVLCGVQEPRQLPQPAQLRSTQQLILKEQATAEDGQQSQEEMDACFERLLEDKFVTPPDRNLSRNWCWVGLKELGCHRHFKDHFTWAEMQSLSGFQVPFRPVQRPDICEAPVHGGQQDWSAADWVLAKEWFREHVAIYVLSLPTSLDRRKSIKRRLDEVHVPFEFVDGIDMRGEGALGNATQTGHIPADFDFNRAQANAYTARQGMHGSGSITGTVGCAAAHFKAQTHGLDGKSDLFVVLEDDVSVSFDFVPRLWRLVTLELPCDWQAVSLYSRCPFGRCVSPHLTRVQPDVNEPEWRCHHGVNYGFQGVLYRASQLENLREMWMPVVFNASRPHCLDLDVALASISDKVHFYAVPAAQRPGFLKELNEGSSRWWINQQAQSYDFQAPTTNTTTTQSMATNGSVEVGVPTRAAAAGPSGDWMSSTASGL